MPKHGLDAGVVESDPKRMAVGLVDAQPLPLPLDVFQEIARHLDARTFASLALVCKSVGSRLTSPHVQAAAKDRYTRKYTSISFGFSTSVSWHLPNCRKHGTDEEWNANGVRTWLRHWVHGNRHGTEEEWNDKGVRTLLRHWVHGKPHGTEEQWNDEGKRTSLCHWVDGKRHGTEQQWNRQGVCTWWLHWKDGKRHGTETHWSDQGMRTLLCHWVHGEMHGIEEW